MKRNVSSTRRHPFLSMIPDLRFFFFSPRLFDRRTFSSKDCFTGQSPGMGHDASHLYTGGSRMCIGEGQVQAGPLTKGLEVCCSEGGWGLQRGSHWWKGYCLQGCGSRIGLGQGGMLQRHAWPHAWAWRSSGGSRRWWGSGAEGLGLGGLWCGRGASGKLRLHHSDGDI